MRERVENVDMLRWTLYNFCNNYEGIIPLGSLQNLQEYCYLKYLWKYYHQIPWAFSWCWSLAWTKLIMVKPMFVIYVPWYLVGYSCIFLGLHYVILLSTNTISGCILEIPWVQGTILECTNNIWCILVCLGCLQSIFHIEFQSIL